jgi:hypothetical protein
MKLTNLEALDLSALFVSLLQYLQPFWLHQAAKMILATRIQI